MFIFCNGRVLSRNEKTYHRSKSYLFISHTLFHFLGIPEYKKIIISDRLGIFLKPQSENIV